MKKSLKLILLAILTLQASSQVFAMEKNSAAEEVNAALADVVATKARTVTAAVRTPGVVVNSVAVNAALAYAVATRDDTMAQILIAYYYNMHSIETPKELNAGLMRMGIKPVAKSNCTVQ